MSSHLMTTRNTILITGKYFDPFVHIGRTSPMACLLLE